MTLKTTNIASESESRHWENNLCVLVIKIPIFHSSQIPQENSLGWFFLTASGVFYERRK